MSFSDRNPNIVRPRFKLVVGLLNKKRGAAKAAPLVARPERAISTCGTLTARLSASLSLFIQCVASRQRTRMPVAWGRGRKNPGYPIMCLSASAH